MPSSLSPTPRRPTDCPRGPEAGTKADADDELVWTVVCTAVGDVVIDDERLLIVKVLMFVWRKEPVVSNARC